MICMGLSFGVATSGWGGVRAMQNSFGWMMVFGQCFFGKYSKKMVSHKKICAMAWLEIERSHIVSSKSFAFYVSYQIKIHSWPLFCPMEIHKPNF
jgi:hypothetical protein